MDGHGFDELARRVAVGASRRGVLRGLVGGLAASALGLTGERSATALGCRGAGRSCREDANCCSEICAPDASGRRRCACPDGAIACGGRCVDPATFQNDPRNCGECGHRCPRGRCQIAVCDAGDCGLAPDPAAVDTLPCDDGDPCTIGDVCQADGSCAGDPVDCSALPSDQCQAGVCDPTTSSCATVLQPNGTACDDGSPLCVSGKCCTAGHMVLNGGCFTIAGSVAGCGAICTSCSNNCDFQILGSNNTWICHAGANGSFCQQTSDCPPGSACHPVNGLCLGAC